MQISMPKQERCYDIMLPKIVSKKKACDESKSAMAHFDSSCLDDTHERAKSFCRGIDSISLGAVSRDLPTQ